MKLANIFTVASAILTIALPLSAQTVPLITEQEHNAVINLLVHAVDSGALKLSEAEYVIKNCTTFDTTLTCDLALREATAVMQVRVDYLEKATKLVEETHEGLQ